MSVYDLSPQLGVSLDETVTERDLDDLLWVFGCESSAVRTVTRSLTLLPFARLLKRTTSV